MSIQRLSIKEFLAGSKSRILLDVRSPGEYDYAHIPRAINLALFSDEERKMVGTAYKQQSREQAIRIGLDFFGPKMRKMVEEVESIAKSRQAANKISETEAADANSIYLHCWRGGMRSAAVAWLLDLYGFKVYSLSGGYKAYRNYVLQIFEQPYHIKLLGGFTGSGKTSVLNELEKNGELIIDLEKIACHKGSAFGGLKMPPQPSQEMFENLLANEFLEKPAPDTRLTSPNASDLPIWLEDESQRIGNLNIPNALWGRMRASPLFFIDIPFEERLNYILEDYGDCETEKLISSVERISKRLGGLEARNTVEFLKQGNIKEAFRILLHYYDKRYLKALHNRESVNSLLTRINCETVCSENARALTKYQTA